MSGRLSQAERASLGLSAGGLIIDGVRVPVPGVRVTTWVDDPKRARRSPTGVRSPSAPSPSCGTPRRASSAAPPRPMRSRRRAPKIRALPEPRDARGFVDSRATPTAT